MLEVITQAELEVEGQHLALLTVLLISTVISGLYVFIIAQFGDVNLKAALGGAVGFFLIGAAYLAIGLFISSCTESQILAAGLSFVVLLVNYFLESIAGMIDLAVTEFTGKSVMSVQQLAVDDDT